MAKVGWLKLHRKIIEWEYFTNPECVQLLVYLLCQADEEGNVFTTVERICADLRLTRQVVRDRLKKLSSTNTSTIKSTINGTHITLCNFTSYNGKKSEVNHQTNHQTNQPEKEKVSPTPPIKENIQESLKESPINGAKESCRFLPPTVQQVQEYIQEKGYAMSAERFHDFYTCKNWYVGKNKMKDWRAAVRNWASRDNQYGQKSNSTSKAEHIAAERERLTQEIIALASGN